MNSRSRRHGQARATPATPHRLGATIAPAPLIVNGHRISLASGTQARNTADFRAVAAHARTSLHRGRRFERVAALAPASTGRQYRAAPRAPARDRWRVVGATRV